MRLELPAKNKKSTKALPSKIANDLMFSLLHSLHRDEILENFTYCLRKHLKFSYLCFKDENDNAIFTYGRKTKNDVTCMLTESKESICGTFVLGRANEFSDKELATLEKSLALVALSLKNAKTHKQALDSAKVDPLTKLLNRYSLDEHLDREINLAKRTNQNLSVLVADLDNFKLINDNFGHLSGDKILVHTSKILRQSARDIDLIFRLGGEEFLIILNNTNQKGALKLAKRIVSNIASEDIIINKKIIPYTISVGAAHLMDSDCKKSLLMRADKALYTAKHLGRNQAADETFIHKTEKTN